MRYQERQLTDDARGHQLTNTNVWTADSQWLAYDVRPQANLFTGKTIEAINVKTGEIKVIYHAPENCHVGVVTVSHSKVPSYVFIHSPDKPTADWQYDFHHRRGVVVSDDNLGVAHNLDAMKVDAPFMPGALRGGTHVHVFNGDDTAISFTYNDHVMHQKGSEYDQRNVGVSLDFQGVAVDLSHPQNYSGSHYSVLVSDTVVNPIAGSDQISRAYEDAWVGYNGYIKASGEKQNTALAFIGDCKNENGEVLSELFIVDLPDDKTAYFDAGKGAIEGTCDQLPKPPKTIKQRRLTFTGQRKFAGLATSVRHWVRSSPDGSMIAFLMKDDEGVVQLWTISPSGGLPRQITQSEFGIQSAFNWHPDGQHIAFVCDNSIVMCHVATGVLQRLTDRTEIAPSADAIVFSPNGEMLAFMRPVNGLNQLCVLQHCP